MRKLPLRYNDKDDKGYCDALMPSQCRYGCNANDVFECMGGERVRVEWVGTFGNENGESKEWLDRIAQYLYGWTFEQVETQWYARLGKLDGWWDEIRIRKV